jgi:hypothetical protein
MYLEEPIGFLRREAEPGYISKEPLYGTPSAFEAASARNF